MAYHIETEEEENERIEQIAKRDREEEAEKRKLLREVEAPIEFRGQVLKKWLDSKSGHVLTKKQHKLKKIGQERHLAFDKWLHERFIREEWYKKGINYKVFDVSMEDVDAIVFNMRTWTPLEVFELSNCSRFRRPFPKGKLSNDPTGSKQVRKLWHKQKKLQRTRASRPSITNNKDITTRFAVDHRYLFKNYFTYVSNASVDRYVTNLTKFNCRRYVVLSYPENLTDYALWEYAKNKIIIKVLGYQD